MENRPPPEDLHHFWRLVTKRDINNDERAIFAAICILSVQPQFRHYKPDELYDVLVAESKKFLDAGFSDLQHRYSEGFLRQILREINEAEHRIVTLVTKVGKDVADNKAALTRVQADVTTLLAKQLALAKEVETISDAVDTESVTLADIAQQLRDAAGSGDTDALNALADKIEGVSDNIDTHTTRLDAIAAKAKAASAAAVAQPVTLTIDPKAATVAPGATQQFTASGPANFSADIGSIGTDGLYTAPTDGSTSAVVTATSQSDPTVSDSASVSISAA